MVRLCPAVFAHLHHVLGIQRGQLYFESCLGHPNGRFETLTFYVDYWEVNFPPAYATCQTVDHLLLDFDLQKRYIPLEKAEIIWNFLLRDPNLV